MFLIQHAHSFFFSNSSLKQFQHSIFFSFSISISYTQYLLQTNLNTVVTHLLHTVRGIVYSLRLLWFDQRSIRYQITKLCISPLWLRLSKIILFHTVRDTIFYFFFFLFYQSISSFPKYFFSSTQSEVLFIIFHSGFHTGTLATQALLLPHRHYYCHTGSAILPHRH